MNSKLDALVKQTVRPLSAYKASAESLTIKLDANESPWPLPEAARQRIAQRVAELSFHRYPDPGAHALRKALAARLGVRDPDTLVLGVGSDEALAMLMRSLSEPRVRGQKARVMFPEPTFVMYGLRAIIEDCEPVPVPLTAQFQLDMPKMQAAIEATCPNLIFLASPNNPTGNCFHDEDIVRVIELAPEALVIIDEAYGAFTGRTLAALAERYDNVAVMGTLSKIGMAALRVGWVRVSRRLADEVEKVRQPYNLSSLSQAVATLALTELWPVLESQVADIRRERTRLSELLQGIPYLTVFPSDANFFLVHVRGDAESVAQKLLAQGVSVRAFRGHGASLAGHLRITVGTPAENDRLIDALRAL